MTPICFTFMQGKCHFADSLHVKQSSPQNSYFPKYFQENSRIIVTTIVTEFRDYFSIFSQIQLKGKPLDNFSQLIGPYMGHVDNLHCSNFRRNCLVKHSNGGSMFAFSRQINTELLTYLASTAFLQLPVPASPATSFCGARKTPKLQHTFCSG